MFTGIVREVGAVLRKEAHRLEIRCRLRAQRGDSVSVNGACLTVVPPARGGRLAFDVSEETWARTGLGALGPGAAVNLEPALRAGDPLGGHLVAGHVDARAAVLAAQSLPEGFVRLRVFLPKALRALVAVKGSIAIDGVSLTVTAAGRHWLETVLVPHTLAATTLGRLRAGQSVNLEADTIARYVQSALARR